MEDNNIVIDKEKRDFILEMVHSDDISNLEMAFDIMQGAKWDAQNVEFFNQVNVEIYRKIGPAQWMKMINKYHGRND